MAANQPAEIATDIRDTVVSCCERIDMAAAKFKDGKPIALGPLIEASRFLAEAFRLLAPEWFSPKVDRRQQGLFVEPAKDE